MDLEEANERIFDLEDQAECLREEIEGADETIVSLREDLEKAQGQLRQVLSDYSKLMDPSKYRVSVVS